MAITISGQNNNDKILASDGVLDQISGFNVVGVMTATTFDVTTKHTANHIDVGSNIQLGNAGVATATTFIGNLTGNVNATSNLLLQIGGSEKFRVGSSGQLGIGGANYGTSGQVLTSGGSGSAATWSTIASDAITEGNTNAEVIDSGSNGFFRVVTESSERLRITSNGIVNIGDGVGNEYLNSTLKIRKDQNAVTRVTIRNEHSGGGSAAAFQIGATGNSWMLQCGSAANDSNAFTIRVDGTSNSNTGTERFRLTTAGAIGLNGTNYGSSGQVLTSQGSSSAPTWTTITGTTINSNADNRIITGSGTANTLNGESTLTYSGDTLLSTNSNFVIKSIDTNASNAENRIQFNAGKMFYETDMNGVVGSSSHIFNIDGSEKFRVKTDGIKVTSANAHGSSIQMYNTDSSSNVWYVNGEGNSFIGHTYPRTDANMDLGFHTGYRWRDLIVSGGIRFGSSSANNYLDEYEEGTFTPVILNGWGILNSNPNISTGKYIRIGAIVHIYFTFKEGSGTGGSYNGNRLALYQLPFNSDGTFGSGGGNNFSHPLVAYTNSSSGGGENVVGVPGNNGATVFSFITKQSNGYGSFTGTNLGSSGTIFCAGTYRISGT
jgi:hypothetical protein